MHSRRWPLLATALLLLWLGFGQELVQRVGRSVLRLDSLPSEYGLSGQLYYAQGFEGLWRHDIRAGESGIWWVPPEGALVTDLAIAPDASQLAMAWAPPAAQGFQSGTTDLWLTSLPEPDPVPFLTRVDVLESWRDPWWSPDGRWLLVTHQRALRDEAGEPESISISVKRVALNGSSETVLENAEQAALSRDGRQMVWLQLNTETWGQALWQGRADGSDSAELVAEGIFRALASPRFSNDGNFIVFSASGERLEPETTARALSGPVRAHGDPWNIWQIELKTGDMTRLTETSLDGPMLSWSPEDRGALGVLAAEGLFVRAGGRMWRLAASGAEGGLAWAPAP